MALQSVQPRTSSSGTKVQSGFKLLKADSPKRVIASVAGPEKSGKNHFAFTAPDPIGVLSMDVGLEGMVDKFVREGKRIHAASYQLEVQPGDAEPTVVANAANPVWMQWVADYRDAIRSYRTIIADTGTEMWELLRLARFGKIGQVMPHHYGPVNAEFREIVREAYDFPVNVIFLHKMKDEWENSINSQGKEVSRKTGRLEIKQMNDMPFLVQTNIQCWREMAGHFHVTITDCRQNPDIAGLDFEQPSCTFNDVATMIFDGEWP